MTARGIFGTIKSGGLFRNAFRTSNKNVGNTNVIHAGDTLYALWEGGMPYELDPLTLKNKKGQGSVGETNLDRLIKKNLVPIQGSTISLYEVDGNTFRTTKGHDKVPSIVFEGPGMLNQKNALKALLGMSGFASCIDVDYTVKDTSIVIVPRSIFDDEGEGIIGIDPFSDDEDRITLVSVPNHFNFHYGNCFEDDLGIIILDTVQTNEVDVGEFSSFRVPFKDIADKFFENVLPRNLVRYTIDIKNKCLAIGIPPEILSTQIPEFPSLPKNMSTRKHKYLYPVGSHFDKDFPSDIKGSGPQGSILKIDTENPDLNERNAFLPHEFPGEVAFAPKVGRDISEPGQEDAGYLLVNTVNARDKITDFAIFDVQGQGSLEKGPLLRQTLPTFLPNMLHGNFAEGVTFDFDMFQN